MVIVIGGSGLVGSHLLCELVQRETTVVATYTRPNKLPTIQKIFAHYFGSTSQEFFDKITWKQVSILDVHALNELIQPGSTVYHCAALVSFHRKDFDKLMKVNREGTANVVNACLYNDAKVLGYISSTAALGDEASGPITEQSKWKNTDSASGYSISKHGAEKEIFRGQEEGLKVTMVNPCVILGVGNWNESSLTILKKIKSGLKFYPPGANAVVDARDVAKGILATVDQERYGERFLLIGSNQSFQKLFDQISRKMDKKPPGILAGKKLMTVAWVLSSIGSKILGQRSPITRETIRSAMSMKEYSNKKSIEELGMSYYSLEETIDNAIEGKVK